MEEAVREKMEQNMSQFTQFMPPFIQNISMQTYNLISEFFTMMQEINEDQRSYYEENKLPQMPYMAVRSNMHDKRVNMQSMNPMANYMPMFASLFMSHEDEE